ncbi:hypothetical protein DFR49_1460 [Hephaestia caeni]|uniref:Peptide ABC transporter permease n=1 Tax=Hephaestia caeni TaxID=645617 RepID=A0A397PGA6_9SPHN|nr:peptide ABC transporter permease [Hephaestia caeni]RIA46899.1 hypothetical protein DFR49_1460 [Hephaestia caeni]
MPDDPPVHLTARQARGGTIILRTRRRRLIFIAGLVALALVAVAIV